MVKYLLNSEESDCCGCGACSQICKSNAIIMNINEEGFVYPTLDTDLCVNCNLCNKVCPMTCNNASRDIIGCFAVQDKNENNLLKSSSGGFFGNIADYIIDNGGIVFGATLNENFDCNIEYVESNLDIDKLRGSKYVESNTKLSYKEAEKLLKEGRKVLYSGTPCQIAGLKQYLRKEYANLITVDFLCHGVPSQKVFKKYIKWESRNGEVKNISFRDKSRYGWGKNVAIVGNKQQTYYEYNNPYIFGFIKEYFNRKSCYSCQFQAENKFSDITMGDFWGVKNYHKDFELFKGVSCVSINTEKGQGVFDEIKHCFQIVETQAEYINKGNSSLLTRSKQSIPSERKNILDKEEMSFEDIIDEMHFEVDSKTKIISKIPKWLLKLLRK